MTDINRRGLIGAGMGVGMLPLLSSCQPTQPGGELNVSTPAASLKTYVKLMGSLAKETVYSSFQGQLWGILPGRAPVPLCGIHGLARSDWEPVGANSYKKTSFDMGFFNDIESGEPLREMENPFSGELVQPFDFKYGGGDQTYAEETENEAGEFESFQADWKIEGDQLNLTEQGSNAYPWIMLPDEWPRESPGDTFYAGSETNYLSSVS